MVKLRRLWADNQAVASVELALMMPILFAFLFTTFEGGHYLWTEHKLIKATRLGARYAARLPTSSFQTCPASGTMANVADSDQVTVNQIRQVTRTGRVDGLAPPKVRGWKLEDIDVKFDCSANSDGIFSGLAGGGRRVIVSTRIKYPSVMGLLGIADPSLIVRGQAEAVVPSV